MSYKKIILGIFVCAVFSPLTSHAALYAPFEVSGWIPYWRSATGTAEFLTHINQFKEINPFGYTVKSDGTLVDEMHLTSAPWPMLNTLLKLEQIRDIPTVMWSDGAAIDKVLRSPNLRAAHIQSIVNMVYQNNFDGVDIDYEAKYAATQPYFAEFLKELYTSIGNKWVMCEVEARTPAADRRDTTPDKPSDYANDYNAIARYCDRVRIMAYDQGSVDQILNASNPGPYQPIADPKWVKDVVNLAAQTIPRSKIMLGIPTYGYEYRVTPNTNGSGYTYQLLWALNPKYATDLAASLGITPTRDSAGELAFTYHATTTPSTDSSFNFVTWSDAQAINDKVKLAKSLGIRGVSLFKIDGGADPAVWTVLP